MKTSHQFSPGKVAGFALIAMALLFIPARSLMAQTPETKKPSAEVQQLKERLQQLEETVDALKTQLKTIGDEKKTGDAATGEKVAARASTAPATTPGVAPKADETKGESTFSVYGFVMLDAGYQFKQADPNWFDTVRPVKLPAFRDQFPPNGNFYTSVRQSRFGVKSSTPTKYGPLNTKFEFEL